MSDMKIAAQFSLRQNVSSEFRRISGDFRRLVGESEEAQKHFRGMGRDLAYAAGSAVLFKKSLDAALGGYRAAKPIQTATLRVEAELFRKDKSLEDLMHWTREARKGAFTVQAKVPGDMAEALELTRLMLKAGAPRESVIGPKGGAMAAAYLSATEEAAGLSKTEAGKIMVSVGTIFERLDDLVSVADYISRASHTANAEVSDLSTALAYVGSDAREAKHGLDDVVPLFVSMTKFGVPSSMIGTSLRQFYASMLGRSSDATKMFAEHGLSFFEGGKYKGMPAIVEMLRGAYAGMSDEEAARFSETVFGIRGKKVKSVFTATGSASIEAINHEIETQMDLWQRVEYALRGADMQAEALKGTARTTVGLLFEPATTGAAKLLGEINKIPAALGEAALEHPGIAAGTTWGTLGLTALAGGAASFFLGRAGYRGLSGLRAIGGWRSLLSGGSLAGGVATGKALEKTAGVQPVFVTNFSDMPAGLGAAGAVGAGSMLGSAGGGAAAGVGAKALLAGAGKIALPVAVVGGLTLLADRLADRISQTVGEARSEREREGRELGLEGKQLQIYVYDGRIETRATGIDKPRVQMRRISGAQSSSGTFAR